MLILKNWKMSLVTSLFCSSNVFAYIPDFLDSSANSFNERVWSGALTTVSQVEQCLSFLNEEDSQVASYSSAKFSDVYEPKIRETSDQALWNFYSTCERIYDNYADIDPVTQAAVSMLFERTLEKYMSHKALLEKMYGTAALLPEDHVLSEESSKTYGPVGCKVEKVGSSYGIINDLKASLS